MGVGIACLLRQLVLANVDAGEASNHLSTILQQLWFVLVRLCCWHCTSWFVSTWGGVLCECFQTTKLHAVMLSACHQLPVLAPLHHDTYH
jgi:hypothetical protein